jgi:hypothetical protein
MPLYIGTLPGGRSVYHFEFAKLSLIISLMRPKYKLVAPVRLDAKSHLSSSDPIKPGIDESPDVLCKNLAIVWPLSGHKIHIPPYLGWCALLETRAQRALDSWNET